jgi:hypothetical protein
MSRTYILTANIEIEVSDCENEHEAIAVAENEIMHHINFDVEEVEDNENN